MSRKRLTQAEIDWAVRIVENSDAVIILPKAASVAQKAALVAKLLTEKNPPYNLASRKGLRGSMPRIYLLSSGEVAS